MRTDKAANLLQEALKQMNDGKYSRSFALLKELLAADPSHAEARRLLATLLLKFGNLGTARTAFETLVKEAFQRQEYTEAQSLLREYLNAAPRCVAFLDLLAQAHELAGDPLAAVFEYEKAIEVLLADPDPERPAYPQELFAKIIKLAPSSFVANRVAARMPVASAQSPNREKIEDTKEASVDVGTPEVEPSAGATPTQEAIALEDGDSGAVAPFDQDDHEDDEVMPPSPVIEGRDREADDDRVPFPPVNTMAPPALHEEPASSVNIEEEAANEPPTEAVSASEDWNASTTSQPLVESEPEPQPTPSFSIADTARQSPKSPDLYWERVTGNASVPSATESSSAEGTKRQRRPPGPGVLGQLASFITGQIALLIKRMVWLTSSFTRLTIALIVAMVVWVVLLIAVVAGTWVHLEEKPSETFQRLTRNGPPKAIEDPNNNGYLLLLGFDAEESQDPLRIGYDRWLTVHPAPYSGCFTQDPTGRLIIPGPHEGGGTSRWFKVRDPMAEWTADAARVHSTVDPKGTGLTRYKQWLTLPFDDWGFGYTGGMACGEILDIHRLYLADGVGQNIMTVLDRIEADVQAWRKVAGQSRTLAMKMLAVAAIDDDMAVLNGLLQRPSVETKVLQRIIRIAKPLDADERSMKWAVQNEFVLHTKRMENRLSRRFEQPSLTGAMVLRMPVPKQRTLNAYADYYDRVATTPWTRSGKMPSYYEFAHAPARTWTDYLLNPIDNLIAADAPLNWQVISGMVLETDARIRLTGLQARLRAPSSEPNPMARVAQAGPSFFDPFTELPMLVNQTSHELYSVGLDGKDDHGDPALDVAVSYHLP